MEPGSLEEHVFGRILEAASTRAVDQIFAEAKMLLLVRQHRIPGDEIFFWTRLYSKLLQHKATSLRRNRLQDSNPVYEYALSHAKRFSQYD